MSGLTVARAAARPTTVNPARMATSGPEVPLKLPSPQTMYACARCGLVQVSSSETRAVTALPSITPMISRVAGTRTVRASTSTWASTRAEPAAAAETVPKRPSRPSPATKPAPAVAPKPVSSTATPRLAPAETPSEKGSARGLRNRVCSCRPAAASAAPAQAAVTARGSRTRVIRVWAAGSAPGCPKSTARVSVRPSETEPVVIANRKSTRVAVSSSGSTRVRRPGRARARPRPSTSSPAGRAGAVVTGRAGGGTPACGPGRRPGAGR